MPFTPIHMGPGLLIKSLLHGSFSLMVFGWSQIVMDIQPLIVMLTGEGHLHGFSHTYFGATLLAVFSSITGKYLSEIGLLLIGISKKSNPIKISWVVAFISACIGTVSHVLLDNIMHSDVQPFYPFSLSGGIYGLMSIDNVHKVCLYSGLIGTAIYFAVQFKIKRK